MDLTSKATNIIIRSIRHTNMLFAFMCTETMAELKLLFVQWLCKDEKPTESFIKGAKLINWSLLLQLIQNERIALLTPYIIALYSYDI